MSAINLNVNSFTDFETIPNDSHPPTFDDTHNFTKLPTSQIDIEDDQVTLLQLMIHKSSSTILRLMLNRFLPRKFAYVLNIPEQF